MKEIRIGIFGGSRGRNYYGPFDAIEGARIVAIADKKPEVREKLKEIVAEDVVVCETWDDMLAVGLDAVILANYFHEHCKYAIMAMEAGLDVISETTAAPTLGECLDLVECVERTGRKYMLAANCPKMPGPAELGSVYQSGVLGEVLYAEAEYCHPMSAEESSALAPEEFHWRKYLPGTYYNMHTLGVLMAATKLLPRRVTAMDVKTKSCEARKGVITNAVSAGIALYEMENGSVFRSTGWVKMRPAGKWFRLSCENGTIETDRENQDRVLLRSTTQKSMLYDPMDWQYTAEERKGGHGGADTRICQQICDYLSGKDEEPIIDIYRGVALSLAAIYGHYSVLEGKTFDIPDMKDKAAREVLRGDYRTPFADPGKEATLACNRG